jgi:hypothetical protein
MKSPFLWFRLPKTLKMELFTLYLTNTKIHNFIRRKEMKKQKKLQKVLNRVTVGLAGALALFMVMAVFAKPQSSFAAPNDLAMAAVQYPNIVGSSLQNCNLCHTASIPSLNPYGAAYKTNGRNSAAFGLIANLDSDGDGFKNVQEFSALTFPGDPASHPAVVVPTAVPPTAIPPTSVPPTAIPPTAIPPTAIPPISVPPTSIPTNIPNSAYVTIGFTPPSVIVGGLSTVAVNLNNIPTGGFASAEFTCTFNPALVEVSNITVTSLFGSGPVTAVNGPQNGSFIVAIAGSNGIKATTGGGAFTFSAKGLQVGQSAIDCKARISTGNQSLSTIPSTPANISITSSPTSSQGVFTGRVLANKSVTITLYNPNSSVAGSIVANLDGTFSLSISAGTYVAIASAPGYLKAQGTFIITNGNTTTSQMVSLHAGDIDGNNVLDQFDALTIGINYNTATPSAADLNNDGVINVLDLEILAGNYRQSGSLAWQ